MIKLDYLPPGSPNSGETLPADTSALIFLGVSTETSQNGTSGKKILIHYASILTSTMMGMYKASILSVTPKTHTPSQQIYLHILRCGPTGHRSLPCLHNPTNP